MKLVTNLGKVGVDWASWDIISKIKVTQDQDPFLEKNKIKIKKYFKKQPGDCL